MAVFSFSVRNSILAALLSLAFYVGLGELSKYRDATYDYVVIGGGTAGLAIASRLSENPRVTVAVLEAGWWYQYTNPLLSDIPAGDTFFSGASPKDSNPFVDWDFITTPQEGAAGRAVHYARGKCVGGTSGRNFMIYQRGDRGTYDVWADAVGDDSYRWDEFLPYFKKGVKFSPPGPKRTPNTSEGIFAADAFTENAGPLSVTYPNFVTPFSGHMRTAMAEIGIPTVPDFNSGKLLGAQYCSATIQADSMKRESSQAYLRAALSRPNFKLYTRTMVAKILFDDEKRATGVKLVNGATLTARNEVILSAGAFQSPQILMVSGVGPAEHLKEFDIPVIADRPGVGQNLSDHVFFSPTYRVNIETMSRLTNSPAFFAKSLLVDYMMHTNGPLATHVSDFLAWERIPEKYLPSDANAELEKFPKTWPDIEYIVANGYVGNFDSMFFGQPNDGYNYASMMAALCKPLSRGTVTLASADSRAKPVIDPRWLTDPTDVAVAIASYKRVREAFNTPALKAIRIDDTEYFPGNHVQTDEEILEIIRNTVMTVWHAATTCRMGRVDDPNAVVDSRARVIGVKNLRVVDASSFAILPPGHPQSTIYALAEKIAADILAGLEAGADAE